MMKDAMNKITKVERWETGDGRVHNTEAAALIHTTYLNISRILENKIASDSYYELDYQDVDKIARLLTYSDVRNKIKELL